MSRHRITSTISGSSFDQCGQDTVLRAALRAGIAFPYECNSGGCGSCKFELIEGTVDKLWPTAQGLSERDQRKGHLLACQCKATNDLQIKFRAGVPQAVAPTPAIRQRATLTGMSELTHDIREFRFTTIEAAAFRPGQYAMLEIPGVPEARAYSMSNIGNTEGQWHFQIRRVRSGRATERLFEHLAIGDTVEIDGPYGHAYLRPDVSRDIICVAGGSGLAPMVSIVRGAAQAEMLNTRRLHFFYGGRTARDICGDDFLQVLGEHASSVLFHPVVSMPQDDTSKHWTGETGFVHEAVQRAFGERLADFEFYLAGPPPMTQAMQEMLMLAHKVPFEQIHFDRFF